MKKLFTLLGVLIMFSVSGFAAQEVAANIQCIPISHASFVIVADTITIYVDPTGDAKRYTNIQPPDMILITHTHFDHFDKVLISALKKQKTVIVGTKAAVGELSYGTILNNGDNKKYGSVSVEAVPAYNISPERRQYHPKGEGNGYVVAVAGKRIYISGDTEDTAEMRNLKNIDYAFVCMNLPYTMSVEQAASGVLAFKPRTVFPYHYRQGEGFADVAKFKQLVAREKSIEVKLLDWYRIPVPQE
ncbi:MAG: MBL fold metallo-hydrolase [Elusimicrobiota bacterium]